MEELRASIIVPTRNRVDDLCHMLESVAVQTEKPREVVIVDSSDVSLLNDNKFLKIRNLLTLENITIVYKHVQRRGAAYQRNIAMQLATGDLFHFLDDDVVLEPDYIYHMHEIFRVYPEYAGGMGTIKTANKSRLTWYRVLRIIFLLQRDGASGKFTFSGMPTHAYGLSEFKEVTVLGGCCMCARSAIARQYAFDENLGAYSYMEDCDFSWRISQKYKLFYNPKAVLDHRCSPIARDSIVDIRARYLRNYSYLFFKNFYPYNRLRIGAYWWSICGLFCEALLCRKYSDFKGYMRGLF